ncbi:hypothetical protein MRX96_044348 [Rhipicephalus microplus]
MPRWTGGDARGVRPETASEETERPEAGQVVSARPGTRTQSGAFLNRGSCREEVEAGRLKTQAACGKDGPERRLLTEQTNAANQTVLEGEAGTPSLGLSPASAVGASRQTIRTLGAAGDSVMTGNLSIPLPFFAFMPLTRAEPWEPAGSASPR